MRRSPGSGSRTSRPRRRFGGAGLGRRRAAPGGQPARVVLARPALRRRAFSARTTCAPCERQNHMNPATNSTSTASTHSIAVVRDARCRRRAGNRRGDAARRTGDIGTVRAAAWKGQHRRHRQQRQRHARGRQPFDTARHQRANPVAHQFEVVVAAVAHHHGRRRQRVLRRIHRIFFGQHDVHAGKQHAVHLFERFGQLLRQPVHVADTVLLGARNQPLAAEQFAEIRVAAARQRIRAGQFGGDHRVGVVDRNVPGRSALRSL